jgi:hypothetical protein
MSFVVKSLKYFSSMRSIVLVVACFTCAGHARRAQTPKSSGKEVPSQIAKALAKHLFAISPAHRRNPEPVSQSRIRQSSTPLMVENAKVLQGQLMQDQWQRQPQTGAAPDRSRQTAAAPVVRRRQDASEQLQQAPGKQPSKPPTSTVLVQGGSLKTWAYQASPDRVQVVLSTDGRPLDADVQLWQGPDNTPCKMRVYSEDGSVRPFSAVIPTPLGSASTVAIRNVGQIEFPLAAYVIANEVDEPVADFRETSLIVQGGALRTFDFDPSVESVEIMLRTDGRPLNARVELLQGPNNDKQVIELYGEDGLERPFFAIIDTPGSGNVVRVVNTAPMEFPMFASVQPHSINDRVLFTDPVIGDR